MTSSTAPTASYVAAAQFSDDVDVQNLLANYLDGTLTVFGSHSITLTTAFVKHALSVDPDALIDAFEHAVLCERYAASTRGKN